MPTIWIVSRADSASAAEATRRLAEHFGPEAVRTDAGAAPAAWRPGDVAVLLLERKADGAATEATWPAEAESFLSARLAAAEPVIPLLVDGVVMPAAQRLPVSLRELSFMHGLPLRAGVTAPRDIGRLIENIESQLHWIVGDEYPHDGWLIPAGVIAACVGAIYSVVLLFDLTWWSFGHEELAEFHRARRWLIVSGPFSLGAGLGMFAAGRWWRAVREYSLRRAERLRQGTGVVPEKPDRLAAISLCAGAAALGWGAPAAIVAAGTALWAWTRRTAADGLGRRSRRLIAAGLAMSVVGSVWTAYAWTRDRGLNKALALREEAYAALDAGESLDEFLASAQEACRAAPWSGLAFLDLGKAQEARGDDEAALEAYDRALENFPLDGQNVFEPSHRRIGEACKLRARLRERQGDTDGAQRDRELADQAAPLFEIFGGVLRFWTWWGPPTDSYWSSMPFPGMEPVY